MNTLLSIFTTHSRRGKWSLIGTLLLSLALGAATYADRTEGIGGLPGHGGGTGSGGGQQAPTPSLFIQGSSQEVLAAVISVEGEGTDELIDLGDGRLRWTFNGDLDVKLNENRLSTTGVKLSVNSPAMGGMTRGTITWPGGTTPAFTILPGAEFPLSYERMLDSGLLHAPATLNLFSLQTGLTTMALDSFGGVLLFELRQ